MYHAVMRSPLEFYDWCFLEESSFRTQMKYLKKHFEVVPLSHALEKLKSNKINCPTVVITFDDGFQNIYDVAFPILHEEGLPATIFLTTGLIDTDDTSWFCRLYHALAVTTKSSFEWNGRMFDLSHGRLKTEACAFLQASLKEYSNSQMLTELRSIILNLGDDPDRPLPINSPFRTLSRKAIGAMAESGLIEFGAHGYTHAILSQLPPRERREEIEKSISAYREVTGQACELFAYPNGRSQDYDAETIRILEGCGVRAAATTIEGPNDAETPAMELRRYGIGANRSLAHFQLKVHHVASLIR